MVDWIGSIPSRKKQKKNQLPRWSACQVQEAAGLAYLNRLVPWWTIEFVSNTIPSVSRKTFTMCPPMLCLTYRWFIGFPWSISGENTNTTQHTRDRDRVYFNLIWSFAFQIENNTIVTVEERNEKEFQWGSAESRRNNYLWLASAALTTESSVKAWRLGSTTLSFELNASFMICCLRSAVMPKACNVSTAPLRIPHSLKDKLSRPADKTRSEFRSGSDKSHKINTWFRGAIVTSSCNCCFNTSNGEWSATGREMSSVSPWPFVPPSTLIEMVHPLPAMIPR